MKNTTAFDQYPLEYDKWFDEHPHVFQSEVLALKEQLSRLPENISGIEVGLGTGRFSQALGIREGIEPSEEIRNLALKRGIETMDARAESLPYSDMHFDFVLLVTVSFLEDLPRVFQEAARVLKPGGSVLVGMIPADSEIGTQYQEKKGQSRFYKHAVFYTVPRVSELMTQAGFKDLEFVQTLSGKLEDIQETEAPREGWGEGSFVVIKAIKK